MFTVVAFNEDRAGITALEPVDGTDDDHVTVVGDDIYVPKFNRLVGQYAGHGVTAVAGSAIQAYLDSPSLRRVTRHEFPKLDNFETTPPASIVDMFPENPIPLDETEALNAYLENSAVCAAGRAMVAAWLAEGALAPVRGDIRTIRCTSVITGTLAVWDSGPLTLAYDLPAGSYQLVGARCLAGATSQLFRFIFPEQWARPGGVSARLITDPDIKEFRAGRLGVWGTFTNRALPRLEVLNVETVANPTVYMDIIKLAR